MLRSKALRACRRYWNTTGCQIQWKVGLHGSCAVHRPSLPQPFTFTFATTCAIQAASTRWRQRQQSALHLMACLARAIGWQAKLRTPRLGTELQRRLGGRQWNCARCCLTDLTILGLCIRWATMEHSATLAMGGPAVYAALGARLAGTNPILQLRLGCDVSPREIEFIRSISRPSSTDRKSVV